MSYIMFLRITPFLPNWFINIVSPVIGRLDGSEIRDAKFCKILWSWGWLLEGIADGEKKLARKIHQTSKIVSCGWNIDLRD